VNQNVGLARDSARNLRPFDFLPLRLRARNPRARPEYFGQSLSDCPRGGEQHPQARTGKSDRDQKWIYVHGLPAVGIENQDSVLSGFKQMAITQFG
jgi:hypothetical protein